MDTSSLPIWAQTAGSVAIAIVAAIIGVIKYVKTNIPSSSNKEVKSLIDTIRDTHEDTGREIKRLVRVLHDLVDSLDLNTESLEELAKEVRKNERVL